MPLTLSEAYILAALATEPERGHTAREVADYTRFCTQTVRNTLFALTYAGLTRQTRKRPAQWHITGSGRRVLRVSGFVDCR